LSVDPRAFFVLKQILPGARPFYYSLELYKDADPHSRLSPEIAERENSEIHSIRGLIIQSPEREQVFRESYNLSVKIPTLILPVTYTGPAVLERKDDLRARYGLPATCRIALHVGGIAWYSWCIELARAFADIPNWCLIFHGYVQSDYLAELSSVIRAEKIKNVLISNTYSQTFEGMYSFLQSGDVGVAWYEDISPNMRTSAKSSGKISAYLKFGLPVITKRYPSAIDAIERPRCGICIDDLSFLQGALDQIVRDYSSYSKNAWLEYERVYRFENYHSQIHDFLEANA
jgi:glycosyltransferase involved in cell wall biosynthesis